ncbi:hypothetical protein DPX39_080020200 [Trypanosoma brucei equiperdum]|uniref:Uncharacterized protein n=1 Tax=Trypanosoma brucei equiperdum TaxID=630700 RepID=A0A3L6L4J9_9TRYP|nr:hypothetical protein DPX39_080020200 [Trypanosoma brucei equiperdum]
MIGESEAFVSFVYLTPAEGLPCETVDRYPQAQLKEGSSCSETSALSRSDASAEVTPGKENWESKVYVKFFDALRKIAKVQWFSVEAGTKMMYLYEMIRAWLPEVTNVVCYTAHSDSWGRHFPLIKDVLSPGTDVPERVFCQEVFLPPCRDMWNWGIVNVVVMQPHGDFTTGYVPLVVHGLFMRSRETLEEQISQMCCTSSAEISYMKMLPLLNCSIRDGLVELTSFFQENEEVEALSQVAVVYPALTTGDLVCADVESRVGQRYTMQGMIKRCHHKNGIVCYDVEDTVLGYVAEGLTCVQVLPL